MTVDTIRRFFTEFTQEERAHIEGMTLDSTCGRCGKSEGVIRYASAIRICAACETAWLPILDLVKREEQ